MRGTRISVELILEWFANGASRSEILEGYTHLQDADLTEALLYAARFLHNEVVIEAERSH